MCRAKYNKHLGMCRAKYNKNLVLCRAKYNKNRSNYATVGIAGRYFDVKNVFKIVT